jgi:hypothetical protein
MTLWRIFHIGPPMARVSAMEVDDEIDELIIASCYINAISATAVLNYYVYSWQWRI